MTPTTHFSSWTHYSGTLAEAVDPGDAVTRLLGYDTVGSGAPAVFELEAGGSAYGFVGAGALELDDALGHPVRLEAGSYFCVPGGLRLSLDAATRVVVCQRMGFAGMRVFGGPIEAAGRLRYIDGCSDSVLVGPPRLGDPCLNHLHFPPGIEQTAHTHPSMRAGMVVRGAGWCETPAGRAALVPGVIFHIPRDGRHRFITEASTLDVVAYHPDSDWGPTDEDHPMLNRTLVDGLKVDNSAQPALELVDGKVA